MIFLHHLLTKLPLHMFHYFILMSCLFLYILLKKYYILWIVFILLFNNLVKHYFCKNIVKLTQLLEFKNKNHC